MDPTGNVGRSREAGDDGPGGSCRHPGADAPTAQENSRHACMTRRNWMPKEINRWAMYPRKTSTASLPESLQMEVSTKANELIETVLKPKNIQPPPENPQLNYLVDIYGNGPHKAFYFCADYRVAGPNPIEPGFEAKFARMQYAGNRRFHLSFMRHTGQWIQLYTDLTVDEGIETIRDDPYFSL